MLLHLFKKQQIIVIAVVQTLPYDGSGGLSWLATLLENFSKYFQRLLQLRRSLLWTFFSPHLLGCILTKMAKWTWTSSTHHRVYLYSVWKGQPNPDPNYGWSTKYNAVRPPLSLTRVRNIYLGRLTLFEGEVRWASKHWPPVSYEVLGWSRIVYVRNFTQRLRLGGVKSIIYCCMGGLVVSSRLTSRGSPWLTNDVKSKNVRDSQSNEIRTMFSYQSFFLLPKSISRFIHNLYTNSW